MLKIERISLELRDAVIEEVDFQFEKALRESKTFGDLLKYKPDELSIKGPVTDGIYSEIRRRYRDKVQDFINNNSIKH